MRTPGLYSFIKSVSVFSFSLYLPFPLSFNLLHFSLSSSAHISHPCFFFPFVSHPISISFFICIFHLFPCLPQSPFLSQCLLFLFLFLFPLLITSILFCSVYHPLILSVSLIFFSITLWLCPFSLLPSLYFQTSLSLPFTVFFLSISVFLQCIPLCMCPPTLFTVSSSFSVFLFFLYSPPQCVSSPVPIQFSALPLFLSVYGSIFKMYLLSNCSGIW